MFEIKNTFSFNKEKLTNGDEYDYVTRTSLNQGILQSTGFVNKRNLNEAGVWSLGLLQMDFFYRKRQWYAGQFVRKIIPKIKLTQNSVLFFTTLLNCQKKILLSVLVRDVDKTFNNLKIQLPITANGEIDFDFMESFIAELEAERVRELEAYLKVTGLSDTTLSPDEKSALNTLNSKTWSEFELGKLFTFKGIKQSKSQKEIPTDQNGIPYIVQSTTNNMCSRYVNKQYLIDTNELPNKGNAIVLGVTLPAISYQPKEFGASQIIEARSDFLNKQNGLFFVTAIYKQMYQFSYQNKPGIEIYKNLKIKLPITANGEIDFDFMESFISGVQKTSIKGVIGLKDKIIEQTKKAI